MLNSSALYDFAATFKEKNSTITAASEFTFTNDNFKEFQAFLKSDKTFLTSQETSFTNAYKTLNASLNKKIKKEYSTIINTLKTEKINALSANRLFLKNAIKEIILDQYYYEEGIYENKVALDYTIIEAVKLLKNNVKYTQILMVKK